MERGRAGEPKNASGNVRSWIQNGLLAKYEMNIHAKIHVGGKDMDVDRVTTVEIKGVGTTKVNLPEAAKKKLAVK